MEKLFDTPRSKSALQSFRVRVEAIEEGTDFENGRNNVITLVLSAMENNAEQWDKNCQVNISWIGQSFIDRLSNNERVLDKDRLDGVCTDCFRFLFELYLSIKNDLAIEFERARRFVVTNVDNFEEDSKGQIEYALRDMPVNIIKNIINSDAISSIKDFNSNQHKAEKLKGEWEKEISEKEKRVNQLKASLDEYENGFNFVGLYQGFDDLATEKTNEKNSLLCWLRILSVVILLPILIELYVILDNVGNISAIKEGLLVSLVPTISFIAICTYYFRILLINYKSVKSQLLQIDLRKTLCRFIQSYSGYSADIKKQDSESLSKFENIIFSGIVSEEAKLPSSYDGLEQISKLVKSMKS
ncbi:hypothetical protein [Thalassotalea euphylliae]|uniref:Uncharacterized protein n=1 Tax=Thalassotalea euphylliae TaxID=1655234 RepID=A0A3E0UJE4_9GAMM|nr:hypothetical protein [Thalassotalea euphylliae]REL35882.1 hypothetical protein DXX92_11355 [Thalassotalea euphylliae]